MDLKEAVMLIIEYGPKYRDGTHPEPERGQQEFAEASMTVLNRLADVTGEDLVTFDGDRAQREADQVSALTYCNVEEWHGQFEGDGL